MRLLNSCACFAQMSHLLVHRFGPTIALHAPEARFLTRNLQTLALIKPFCRIGFKYGQP
jgi:hypothetical protein